MKDINSINFTKYSSITDNSRNVTNDGVFIAIEGNIYDGHNHIDEAIKKGAILIVIDKNKKSTLQSIPSHVKIITVADTRIALSIISAQTYPNKPENIVAITGTNGKTSVAYFFQQLLSLLGTKAVSIGTLGILRNNKSIIAPEGSLTTLGTLQMHKILKDLKKKQIDYVALEASSHGLVQHRLDCIPFKGAAFTSFSRDHLDYHKTLSKYLKAKFHLFDHLLSPGSFVILNSEMEIADKLINLCKAKKLIPLTYGKNGKFIKIISIKQSGFSFIVTFSLNKKKYQFTCNLFGQYQVYNILCTLGLLISLGFDIEVLLPLLERLSNVPGRMQRVSNSNVYIDYAHTPDALENTLNSIKEYVSHQKTKRKIIVVFGCGGNRDKGKRPKMGKIVSKLADVVIVTDDNPRNEDPALIRKEIKKGCPRAIEIENREEAIKHAIQHSSPSDLILIAGKGHETLQIIGNTSVHFDDFEVAKEYLT